MAQPKGAQMWGEPGTRLVRLVVDSSGLHVTSSLIDEGHDPLHAQWLPSLEHPSGQDPFERPALLFTAGSNAGGFSNNVNELKTDVWFVWPGDG